MAQLLPASMPRSWIKGSKFDEEAARRHRARMASSRSCVALPTVPKRARQKRPPPVSKPVFAASTSKASAAVSADSSACRPPRLFFGFCSLPGEGREGRGRGSNVSTDRVVVAEEFCGQRNQTMLMLVDGHGFAGSEVADAVASTLPDFLGGVRTRVPQRRRRKKPKGSQQGALHEGLEEEARTVFDAEEHTHSALASTLASRTRTQAVSRLLISSSAPVLPGLPPLRSSLTRSRDLSVAELASLVGGSSSLPHKGDASLPESSSLRRADSANELAWMHSVSGTSVAPLKDLAGKAVALEKRASLTMRKAFQQVHRRLIQGDSLHLQQRASPRAGDSRLAAPRVSAIDVSFSGASTLVLIVRETNLIIAHAGLCRAVVGHQIPRALATATASRGLSRNAARLSAIGADPSDPGAVRVGSRPQKPSMSGGSALDPLATGAATQWLSTGIMQFESLPTFPGLPPALRQVMRESDIPAWDEHSATEWAEEQDRENRLRALADPSSFTRSRTQSTASVGSAPPRMELVVAAAPLTLDHRPDRPDEMVRVQALGARVEYFRYEDGTLGQIPRLFADHSDGPGLPLCRALGFSDPVVSKAGVLADPEVSFRQLTRSDKFVIIGSDGLWMSLNAQEAVAIVEAIAQGVTMGGSLARSDGTTRPGLQPIAPLADESATMTIPRPLIGQESVTVAAADEGFVTGMGGGPSLGPVPARGTTEATRVEGRGDWVHADWDLSELLLPPEVREARQYRLQRLAASAAEALVAAAVENHRTSKGERGMRDDMTAIVVWFEHAPANS
jgi:serine/threonine protein phosphatase PrpC